MARVWVFPTKKECIDKRLTLKNPGSYQIVKNRNENGKFARGWKLEKIPNLN